MSDNGWDPFRGLLGVIRGQAAGLIHSTFVLGRVLAVSAESIRIQADGHELDEQDILVNAGLAAPQITLNFAKAGPCTMVGKLNGAAAPCGQGAHDWFRVDDFEGQVEVPALKAGDLVLLMPDESRQLYYLICKVVRYGTFSAD